MRGDIGDKDNAHITLTKQNKDWLIIAITTAREAEEDGLISELGLICQDQLTLPLA
jgi:hypothetical protein